MSQEALPHLMRLAMSKCDIRAINKRSEYTRPECSAARMGLDVCKEDAAQYRRATKAMTTTPTPSGTPDSCHIAAAADSSQNSWGGFLYRNWKWLAGLMVLGLVVDFFDGHPSESPESPQRLSTTARTDNGVKPGGLPSGEMSQVMRNAFALRLGMSTNETMRILGRPPTESKRTDPADHAVPGLPIINPSPFTIHTWSSATSPGETFVMVGISEDRVFEVSVYKDGGPTLSLSKD